ncbi:hypothetical protein LR48_Vigan02g080300 [Vigna angularis]|uniref:DUF8039 domain-containing protein n=1 Tax=Phaseolus angularis TaxID=3914 RepID=A0A0L9TVM9_PHAAN|nr:hypothetical protein LR48_Vigan02g080300 [Vigna angularis]
MHHSSEATSSTSRASVPCLATSLFLLRIRGRIGKGSCLAAGAPGHDMDDTRPCQLYILSPIGTMLAARGIVYEPATIVHGIELAEDEVKVTVDEVVVPDALLLMPIEEFFTMAQAFQSFTT